MNILFTIISILIIYYLFSEFSKKINLPSVVALIIFGVFLGHPLMSDLFIGKNKELIYILGDIGIISLMFLAGLESSWKMLKKEESDAFYVAFFAAIIPFFLGFFTFIILGYSSLAAFIVGLCMSITAEATKAKLLFELNVLKTKVGSTMIGAGIIDDLFGLTLFSVIMFLTGIAQFHEHIILLSILFAFFIGLAVQKRAKEHHLTKKIELSLNYMFVPFFFISMGLHFNIDSLMISYKQLILIIIIAIIGKLGGTLCAKYYTKFSYKQLYLIGWGMNSRGAVELALALVAFKAAMIDETLYSSLVFMALITTLIFPFIITNMIKKHKNIMN